MPKGQLLPVRSSDPEGSVYLGMLVGGLGRHASQVRIEESHCFALAVTGGQRMLQIEQGVVRLVGDE